MGKEIEVQIESKLAEFADVVCRIFETLDARVRVRFDELEARLEERAEPSSSGARSTSWKERLHAVERRFDDLDVPASMDWRASLMRLGWRGQPGVRVEAERTMDG